MKIFNNLVSNLFYVDTRTLALFRIYFGIIGLIDVLRRYSIIDVFYSNLGMDFRQKSYFSVLNYFNDPFLVKIFFILISISFVLFIIGFYTRFFQFISVIGLISIHNAAVVLENGADMVINNYLIWTLFLPLGASISIDSLRKSLNQCTDITSEDLNREYKSLHSSIFHVAYFACLVQLAIIYLYNGLNKTGSMWVEDFTAIHYMYQLETFITPIGEVISLIAPIWLIAFLTLMTLYIELLAPIAILSPIFQPWLRRIVLIVFIPFHLIILLSVNIGLFSWIMFAALILLLSKNDIDFLKRLLRKLHNKKYTIFYDRDCGFCHLSARVLKRMDLFSNLRWADSKSKLEKPNNINSLLENTIVAWDVESDKIWTRHIAFSKIISSLPLGFLFSWILRVPLIEKFFGLGYDIVSKNRQKISITIGLPACGIHDDNNISMEQSSNKSSIRFLDMSIYQHIRKIFIYMSNVVVFILLVGAVDYSVSVNKLSELISEKIRTEKIHKKKEKKVSKSKKDIRYRMKRVLLYPRMHQKWNMFSPSVMTSETWVTANIRFKNGDSLTLFQNGNNIKDGFNRKYFKPYSNQFWRKLFGRLGSSHRTYIPKFKLWLKNTNYFDIYKGREVLELDLIKFSEKSPKPGISIENYPRVYDYPLKYYKNNKPKKKNKGYRKSKMKPAKRK